MVWNRIRPYAEISSEQLYKGITYTREIRQTPRTMVVHVIEIDLREPGISFLVTPGDPDQELPLKARTTSKFLNDYDLQLAVNGDGFSPWYSNNLFSYYPHTGDRVEPVGYAASRGKVYSLDTDNEPTLFLSKTNRVRFDQSSGNVYNAISGNQYLVERGKPLPLPEESPQPRTAIGTDRNMRTLIIVVIDGRQPGYSSGATLTELASIMAEFGAYRAINLDGGGSSTLVKQGPLNQPTVLNSPIEHNIPGRQRVIGNHLGIYAETLDN